MAFYGCEFIFDGLPSSTYGLMIYNFGAITEDGSYSTTNIVEDRTALRSTPLHYGVIQNSPLSFTLSFGVCNELIDQNKYLDRWEMDAIATWLTGHDEYKYLDIIQPDMDVMRYKCIITNLRYKTYGELPWGFECTVTCDSPYGYLYPETYIENVAGTKEISLFSHAATKYYYPKLTITIPEDAFDGISEDSAFSLSIVNNSDNGRTFSLTNLGHFSDTITIDNENEIITSARSINLYAGFNGKFLRLVRGHNLLTVNCGKCTFNMTCEYPVNIGG